MTVAGHDQRLRFAPVSRSRPACSRLRRCRQFSSFQVLPRDASRAGFAGRFSRLKPVADGARAGPLRGGWRGSGGGSSGARRRWPVRWASGRRPRHPPSGSGRPNAGGGDETRRSCGQSGGREPSGAPLFAASKTRRPKPDCPPRSGHPRPWGRCDDVEGGLLADLRQSAILAAIAGPLHDEPTQAIGHAPHVRLAGRPPTRSARSRSRLRNSVSSTSPSAS